MTAPRTYRPEPLANEHGIHLVSVRRCAHGIIRRAWYASERDKQPVERMDVVTFRRGRRTLRCEKCDGKARR